MNVFDYLFSESKELEKDFLLGVTERASYQKIYWQSLLLAEYLRSNVGENQKIIVMGHNSLFFITAYLGILKSGNICIPLNPVLEHENLRYIVSLIDCRLSFISQHVTLPSDLSITVINESVLDKLISENTNYDEQKNNNGFDDNRIAEIIFTSGSTGTPKGVMLSHRNLKTNTSSIVEYLSLSGNDIAAIVLPFYYCYGLSVLHTHIKVGGSVVLNNNFILLGTVIDNLLKYKCTGFAGVPSHFQILLRKSKKFTSTKFPHLRYVTQAGGKLQPVFITEFKDAFPDIDFFVMYGQTEATARLSYLHPNYLTDKIGSIGKGIPGVILEVLNEQGVPVKPGETGEIVAKGDNVMIGYFKDVEGTNEVLKKGWLYTGDMATVDEDGFIYVVARKKEIIKVGGNRVSPKEIEEVILTVPEVLDCTISEVNDELLGEAIKATVVLAGTYDTLHIKEIILKQCRERLSLYKIPSYWEFTEKMELASNGKKITKIKS